jgi:hypothetical protein
MLDYWALDGGMGRVPPLRPFDPVVTRRINRLPLALEPVLQRAGLRAAFCHDVHTGGRLSMDEPFAPGGGQPGTPVWRARGRIDWTWLGVPRRARITVCIEAFDTTAAKLRLWPRSRHIRSWGQRRLTRYFELAHASADLLVAHLAGQAASSPNAAGSVGCATRTPVCPIPD